MQTDQIGLAGKEAVKLEGVRGAGEAGEAGKRVTGDRRDGRRVKGDSHRLRLTLALELRLIRARLGVRVRRVLRRALSPAGLEVFACGQRGGILSGRKSCPHVYVRISMAFLAPE